VLYLSTTHEDLQESGGIASNIQNLVEFYSRDIELKYCLAFLTRSSSVIECSDWLNTSDLYAGFLGYNLDLNYGIS
jgi:hypothetical protein